MRTPQERADDLRLLVEDDCDLCDGMGFYDSTEGVVGCTGCKSTGRVQAAMSLAELRELLAATVTTTTDNYPAQPCAVCGDLAFDGHSLCAACRPGGQP